jgi:glycosyltransferase involved in cell wall biosynthesis
MLIVTNIERFPLTWRAGNGTSGTSVIARTTADFLRHREAPGSVFVVNCDPPLTFRLAAALWFRKSPDLISVDLVLRRSENFANRIALPGKRLLLKRIQHHIHHFRDVGPYCEVYGIKPDHCSFVPFKASLQFEEEFLPDGDGKYVLCFGRSMRDFDTFFNAMEKLEYPAAIPEPHFASFREHGSRFTRPRNKLPPNVEVLPDDKSTEAQKRMLRDARLVVLPILKSSVVASGIGTSLNAMRAGKCVIGTEGVGMSDIFNSEMLLAPPENPEALANVIRRAWEDSQLRQRTAEAGQRYARSLGGEQELYQRLIDDIAVLSSQEWR